ncbi:hypothetical protein [uncultured Brevundimonas sp.]|uniref:hypothetical protein n=1 Tax=uncultured Brevundimonas sp. TaxID=213418 RepID=UPI0030ECFF72|tara:strand:+ start:10940 stop:12421 length:1482 start_codon:yes stop_codon:yes gene_type:complete
MTNRPVRGLISGVAFGLAVALSGAIAGQPSDASAQVAARVESQTRPNFGILLDPPTHATRRRTTHHRRYDYRRDHRPDWRPEPYRHGGEEIVLVDCGGNPGSGAVEDAVRRVRPGGTLVIRARAGACVGWLDIDKPMTVIGEGGFDPRDWGRGTTPTLQAPDGLPCITVARGVRVEIRDVVFASPNGGDAACIVGYGAEIVLNRVGFRHVGDEAAIYADGGLIDIRNAMIDAQTIAPAIIADGAALTAYELVVTGAQTGIELIPGAGQTSRISTSTFKGTGAPNSFGPRSIGMIIRSGRAYGRVEIENTAILGYVEGVAIEGASVSIHGSRVGRSDKGVVLYNGELTLADSRIRASTVGVAAASGRAVVTNNVFAGVRQVFFTERSATLEASGNRVWSQHVCRPTFRDRYRGRYEPQWNGGDGWTCVNAPYPRDWWDDEDGMLGLPYQDDSYHLDGYDAYQNGSGWYDRDGRYVEDDRYTGDDRWSRGGGWRR